MLLLRRGAPTVLGRAVRRLSYPAHTIVPMPALSPTMQQGNIASWKVKEGDEVASGDVIAEVETDKATVDFDTQDDGVIAKIRRDFAAQSNDQPKWMVLDGDIDAEWIESINAFRRQVNANIAQLEADMAALNSPGMQ